MSNSKIKSKFLLSILMILAFMFVGSGLLFVNPQTTVVYADNPSYSGGDTLNLDDLQVGDIISGAYSVVTGNTITVINLVPNRYAAMDPNNVANGTMKMYIEAYPSSFINKDGTICFHISDMDVDFYPIAENGEQGTGWVVVAIENGEVCFGGYQVGQSSEQSSVVFSRVTDESQITAENIGTCTAEDAKAWILANWDDLLGDSSFAEIAFYSNPGELKVVEVEASVSKEDFSDDYDMYLHPGLTISDLQAWFITGDPVFICTAAPTYAQYKNTTTVIKFDDKDWYLIDYDDSTVTLLSKECVGVSRFGSENTYAGSMVETAVNNYYAESISTGAKTAVSNNKMFLLSTDEAEIIYNANPDVLKCSKPSDAEDNVWWLCSQGYDYYYAAGVYGEDGEVDGDGYNLSYEYGVRPALMLDLSKVEFDSETKTFAVPTPTHTHNYSTDWSSDDSTHWHACTGEGDCDTPKADEAAHSYSNTMDNTDYYTCECGYVNNDRKAAYDSATAVAAVKAKINAIGTVEYTTESKGKIDEAREAYDALTADQKALVDNYATLTTAESTYAALKADNDAADEVKAKIAAIGIVEYTAENKAKIDEARIAYEALTPDQKALVTNYETLTTAEAEYKTLDDNAKADEVKAKIAAIGEVAYTTESKGKIDEAREAYEALTPNQKALVTNYETLTTAEAEYKTLDDNAKADEVKVKIAAIGTVEYTADSKTKIDEAREAYNALTNDQKALVDTYETLTTAESTYATLKANNDAADEVKALIAAIGEVTYTTESKGKIDEAREAYDALTADQKALVDNYATLTTAESTYATLKADNDAADEVKAKIAAIGTVEYTAENKAKIDEAREAYNALTPEQKALVTNYETLTTAEAEYKTMDDNAKADEVKAKITAIGTVEYTADSKTKIDEARYAYNALTNDQKALVDTYETLTTAENTYATLKADNDAADEVKAKIAAIGTVEYNTSSLEKIEAAENAYNALTNEQQLLVSNYDVLTEARADYDAVDNVVNKITAIGDVEYTENCKNLIQEARTAYNTLSAELKNLVVNYVVLTKAENDYNSVDNVVKKIDNIGEVVYVGTHNAKIEEARTAYNALNAEQKAVVTNYSTLTSAENAYATLKQQNETSYIKNEDDKVKVEVKQGSGIPNYVELKVEVKTTVSAEEGSADYEAILEKLEKNEKIAKVFNVKLIQTINGVETEIQPNDIEEGMIITVRMELPQGISVKNLRILHIHSANDMEFVENFTVDGNEISFDVNRLSEFAFVTPKGLSVWAIAGITLGCLVLVGLIGFGCWYMMRQRRNKMVAVNAVNVEKATIAEEDNSTKKEVVKTSKPEPKKKRKTKTQKKLKKKRNKNRKK